MNKIYKVVWSKAKNMYVVASELAKNSTKGCSAKKLLTMLIATGVMAGCLSITGGQVVEAGPKVDIDVPTVSIEGPEGKMMRSHFDTVADNNKDAVPAENGKVDVVAEETTGVLGILGGTNITTNLEKNVSGSFNSTDITVSLNDQVYLTDANGKIVIGANAVTAEIGKSTGGTVPVHDRLVISKDGIVYNNSDHDVVSGGVKLTREVHMDGNGIYETYNTNGSPVKADEQKNPRWNGIKFSDYQQSLELSGGTVKGKNALSFGSLSEAGTNSIALGIQSQAADKDSIAIGSQAKAIKGTKSIDNIWNIAIGTQAESTGANTLAIGALTKADDRWSVAIGYSAQSTGWASTAIGAGTYANDPDRPGSVKMLATTASKDFSLAVGPGATASAVRAIAEGYTASATGISSTAIGDRARATGNGATVMGMYAQGAANTTLALGYGATAVIADSAAVGSFSYANTPAGKIGYDITTNTARDLDGLGAKDLATWQATMPAMSIGGVQQNSDGNLAYITRQITNVAAGTEDTDAVNVAQLKRALGDIEVTTVIDQSNVDKSTTNVVIDGDVNPVVSLEKDKNESTLTIGSGENSRSAVIKDVIVKSEDKKTTIQVGNAAPVTIKAENTAVNDITNITASEENGEITITQTTRHDTMEDGEWTKGKEETTKITGIASKSYVDNEMNQLDNRIDNVDNKVNKLSGRVNKVGAGAAALAALHPLDFDPDDKLTFAAGYGNYKGENAAAIGAFYRPDEKVMFNVGGTVGNDNNMVNAGVSFSLDRTANVTNSRTAMAKDLLEMKTRLAKVEHYMEQMMSSNIGNGQAVRDIFFPDIPQNHWAYEYVMGLAKKGVIEGYPDGNFGGDRPMTRYEFSAMLYRAMQNGEKLNDLIAKAFEPELEQVAKDMRFRVDRISGEDNDKRKVERVRVNGNEKDADGKITQYRDHYGSKISKPKAK